MKFRTSAALLAMTALFLLFPRSVPAQAPQDKCRFIFLGYKYLRLSDSVFSHDTHPDDWFLSNADVSGSAGATDLGGALHFITLGLGYQPSLSDSISVNLDAGFLLGYNRDRHQNANDRRPAGDAAFIYSQARFGMFGAVGLSYHIKGFYFGAEAQLASILVEAGWDRYGSDDTDNIKVHHELSAGPKFGYRWKDHFGFPGPISIEGTVQFNRFVTFGVQLVLNF